MFPRTAPPHQPGEAPRLEYDVQLFEPGDVRIEVTLAPTLDFTGGSGLRYGVSIDDGPEQIVDAQEGQGRRILVASQTPPRSDLGPPESRIEPERRVAVDR